jgi:hypothetical protein
VDILICVSESKNNYEESNVTRRKKERRLFNLRKRKKKLQIM